MSKKIENTRKVTFLADYKASKDGKVLYKKDDVAYIHKDVVEIIKDNGGKVKVEEVNEKKLIAAKNDKK